MAVVDFAIIGILIISTVVGLLRGFIKEAVSLVALVIAVWASLRFAPFGKAAIGSVIGFGPIEQSPAAQMWLGRALVFFGILILGGLIGWLISYVINKSGLTGTDRVLGMGFGFARGAILLGVVALAADYLGFAEDPWWQKGRLVPHAERMGSVVKLMAPKALEYLKDAAPEVDEVPESAEPIAYYPLIQTRSCTSEEIVCAES